LLAVEYVGTEPVPTIKARARVLAEDLYSAVDLPHFHRAAMDGYAVNAKDTFGASQSLPAYLKLAGVVEMGKEATRALNSGEAIRISTGGMMPPQADAVVMVEYTDETDAGLVEITRRVTVAKRHSNRRRYQKR
jgi:molybdopterin molybdotransferase